MCLAVAAERSAWAPRLDLKGSDPFSVLVLLEDLLPDEGKKAVAVGVIEEDRLLGIASRCDMMERPGIVQL